MAASGAQRAVRNNLRHAVASILGFGGAMAVAKFLLPPQTAELEQAADERRQDGAAPAAAASGSGSVEGEGVTAGLKDQLLLAQVVFRHGARTPLGKRYWPELGPQWDVCGKAFDAVPIEVLSEKGGPRPPNPDDQKQVETRYAGGCSKGELTLVGQEQAREFGRWLRWRYNMVVPLLPGSYQEGVVNARTTNYSRTIATLQGVLSGLWPGTKSNIPVHTTEEIDEILYTNVKSCRKLHNLMLELHKQEQRRGEPPHTEELAQQVRSALGLPPGKRIHFVDLHDAVTSMLVHKKEIPTGLRDEALLRGVNQHATQRFMHLIAPHPDTGKQQEVLRLGMGVLMEMMVQRMEAAAGGKNGDTRMYLYSGHDSSIMPLLAALGKEVGDWPPYLSNLALELWRRPGGEHYIKVLYNQRELPLTELCGGASCELRLFKEKVVGPYLLTRDQHQKECVMHFLHDEPAGEHTETEDVAVGSSMQEKEEA